MVLIVGSVAGCAVLLAVLLAVLNAAVGDGGERGAAGGSRGLVCEPETVVDRPMEYKRQAVTGETLLREGCVDAFVGGYAKEETVVVDHWDREVGECGSWET